MRKILFTPFLLAVVVLLSGCEDKETWQKAVRKSYGEVIDFDWNKQFVFNDTVLQNDYCLGIPIKIVSVLEDNICDTCLINYMRGASLFMDDLNTDSVVFMAISKHRSEEQLRGIMHNIDSKRCVMIQDIDDKYFGNERLQKDNISFKAYLLDCYNRIILCGDPLLSYKLETLYVSTINDLIGRGGVLEGENGKDVSFVKIKTGTVNVGEIRVNDPTPFTVKIRNTNKRPVRVNVESQCDCTVLNLETFEMLPESRAQIEGTVVVENEGPFIKYVFVSMPDKDEFQTVMIKGTAVND